MDGTVNDFFNEIDQIVPPKEIKNDSEWQKCYDDSSGYSYYWNVKTDKVTWEMPEEYKDWKEQNTSHKPGHLYVPPKSTSCFPSTTLSSTTKIYEIQKDSLNFPLDDTHKSVSTKKPCTSLNDQKILVISSYGDDSEESETETLSKNQPAVSGPHWPNERMEQINSSSPSDTDEDDDDLLSRIQNRAKVLRDLGGELPPDVEKLVEKEDSEREEKYANKEKKDVTGFSLLAGYGDSEEEEEETKTTTLSTSKNKIHHSILFPLSKPIDVTQFSESKTEHESLDLQTEVDSKAFHRKRRINIDFADKKPKIQFDNRLDEIGERQGLGFKPKLETGGNNYDNDQGISKNKPKLDYPGFQSGGLMFVSPTVFIESDVKTVQIDEDADKTLAKIEETRQTLNEKLVFLSEGREPASPVQIMIIQMETLYEAMKVGGLTMNYLRKWLKETCSELVKLERDAAPSGWLLQWDRTNKRYYYRNQQTGVSQWEYPEPDIVGGDEAMDISTTPPPPAVEDIASFTGTLPVQPPPPPRIKSPTPPPPPTISKNTKQKKKAVKVCNDPPPLPSEIPPPLESMHREPLPPGVELSEVTRYNSSSPPLVEVRLPQPNINDMLGSAINSFYSDLAALENKAVDVVPPPSAARSRHRETISDTSVIEEKKKKKTKVKLVQGLAMKKKGVSKLVERWKNVQKDY